MSLTFLLFQLLFFALDIFRDVTDLAETIGGLLTRAAGRIPRAGDRYLLAGLEFDIVDASPTKLTRVVVRRGAPAPVPLDREGLP